MNTEILNLISNVVEDYTSSKRLFTAYDVTLAVRGQTRTNVRHPEAKEEVHRLMDQHLRSSTYLRDLISIGNAEPPYLYYPYGEDPSTYLAQQANGRMAAVVSKLAPALPASSDDARRQDNRGRVLVPAALIRDIGLAPNQVAYISAMPNKLIVHAEYPDSYAVSYVVDKDYGVRISRGILENADLDGKTYNFDVDQKTIIITGN